MPSYSIDRSEKQDNFTSRVFTFHHRSKSYLFSYPVHTDTLVKPLQQWKLSAIQEKLDRLLDAHLDGVITREEYIGRKEKLLNEKAGFTERVAVVERKGNHWLEPLEGFVKSAHQAGFVASGRNLESLKDFSKRIGSNVQVRPHWVHNTKGRFSLLTSKKPGFRGSSTFGWRAKTCKFLIKIPGPSWPKDAGIQNGGPNGIRTRVCALRGRKRMKTWTDI